MECNRDEAIRAKTLAEKKLVNRDFMGAKKLVLKAKTLYPELDGIPQMLTTLDVYISGERMFSGEVEWYGVLGVNPSDDEETIRKQYRKLALILHPDKNKSVGADGAFKLLSEAWSLLSNKAKRLAYNQRRRMRSYRPRKVQSQSGGTNLRPNSCRTTTPGRPPAPDPPPVIHRADTFWTLCHGCKMHYEYLKVYLNNTLLCPNCHEPFLAKETAAPASFSTSGRQQHQDSSIRNPHAATQNSPSGPNSSNNRNSFWGLFSGINVPCNTDPSIASKAADVVQRVNDRFKREREEFYDGRPSKISKVDGTDQSSFSSGSITGLRTTSFDTNGAYGFSSMNCRLNLNSTRELTQLETRNMLMQKAQTEICRKISEWLSEEENKESPANNVNGNHASSAKKSVHETVDTHDHQKHAMNVPDPDFHDFDLDRTENSFQDNQVWSAYDDDDGMPRFYALIHKVLSRNPLKMKISWLNSKTTAEFGQMDWIASGFRKTCGEFRVGKFEINKSLNSFSQKVEWMKTPRGTVLIYPKKGEVWALYRNWSCDWNEHVPDHVIHKYDMVEVLDDYNEEQGVTVSPIVKFTGFRTVFRPHTDESEVKKIPKEEMFRFSHQVPNYLLTGEEAHNSPKGFLELDPAATSLELIQADHDAAKRLKIANTP